jgi:hypothetical protein
MIVSYLREELAEESFVLDKIASPIVREDVEGPVALMLLPPRSYIIIDLPTKPFEEADRA